MQISKDIVSGPKSNN